MVLRILIKMFRKLWGSIPLFRQTWVCKTFFICRCRITILINRIGVILVPFIIYFWDINKYKNDLNQIGKKRNILFCLPKSKWPYFICVSISVSCSILNLFIKACISAETALCSSCLSSYIVWASKKKDSVLLYCFFFFVDLGTRSQHISRKILMQKKRKIDDWRFGLDDGMYWKKIDLRCWNGIMLFMFVFIHFFEHLKKGFSILLYFFFLWTLEQEAGIFPGKFWRKNKTNWRLAALKTECIENKIGSVVLQNTNVLKFFISQKIFLQKQIGH